MFYDDKVVAKREDVNKLSYGSSDMNELFVKKIMENIEKGSKVLDIGTGNGFVLRILQKKIDFDVGLVGMDNSPQMIEECKKLQGVEAILASNYAIPFPAESFDIVTAKNVTRFSAKEIFRVLKPNGKFIFREYGKGKGLCEISELFAERLIRARDCSYYVRKLSLAGFLKFSIEKFEITRVYENIQDVIDIMNSFPYIKDFSVEDEDVVREYFQGKVNCTITSDPFIIIGGKS